MDATIAFVTHLARGVDHAAGRIHATLGGLALLMFVVLGLALAAGVLLADVMAPVPEDIVAAPFRWRY